jgi:VanZ family protein
VEAPMTIRKAPEHLRRSADASRQIAAYGFRISLALFCYGALFPFTLDLSRSQLSAAWAHASLLPFWNMPGGRAHDIADIVANLLVALPLGFFGCLRCAGNSRAAAFWKWGAVGAILGLGAEALQLAIPGRSSGTTDILTNGLGALAGVAIARGFGGRVLEFLTGSTSERRNIYLWMLILSLVAMVGPFDIGPDYLSRFKTNLAGLGAAWIPISLSGDEWIRIAGFAMTGAFASRLAVPGRRRRSPRTMMSALALVVVFPAVLGCARLLVESYPPQGPELAVEFLASMSGFAVALMVPGVVRASAGLILWILALIAAGLSPSHFAGFAGFQWIPFYEFVTHRTPIAFYPMVFTLFGFAVAGGLLQLCCARCRHIHVVACGLVLASLIEYAKVLLPAHSANITDILMACLGAWAGSFLCAAVAASRKTADGT